MKNDPQYPLPFSANDPATEGLQFLENIATAYWYSQILFSAITIDLFSKLESGHVYLQDIALVTNCRSHELARLLRGLEKMNLVLYHDKMWTNSVAASRYLVRGKPNYMGEFFLYRQYMQPNWQQLTERIQVRKQPEKELDYEERNFRYVRAMDCLVRQKGAEIARLFTGVTLSGPVLDIGGGAGSLLRAIRDRYTSQATNGKNFAGELFELEEILTAARKLYQNPDDWQQIATISGDFRSHVFHSCYSGIIISNFLHAYGEEEARHLLLKALNLLDDDGFLLIHDYFPDRSAVVEQKGALYDLCMMLNTYNGRCHEMQEIRQWLKESETGRKMPVSILDLQTDSTLMIVGGPRSWHNLGDGWIEDAHQIGFDKISSIPPEQVITAPWVNQKCRFGCRGFAKNLQCPPHTGSADETRKLLECYTTALLVQGQPPGRDFHKKLLELERRTFLRGYHKALVYGAGPCTLCSDCPIDETCRNPEQARPSMEASGIDVYATARSVGWNLDVVQDRNGFVKYIGLLLVE